MSTYSLRGGVVMPVSLSYPGVYIEELPSGVRTITGVATSIAAFVGYTARGESNKAVLISSYADFERQYGGLHRDSPVSYAVRQFFANGGSQALIVRVANGDQVAQWPLVKSGNPVLLVETASSGSWANSLRISVDVDNPENLPRNKDAEFNLVVWQVQSDGITHVMLENHRNLNMNDQSPNFAPSVINNNSTLIRATRQPGITFSTSGSAVSAVTPTFPLTMTDSVLRGTIDGTTSFRLLLGGSPWADMDALVAAANLAINAEGLSGDLIATESGADGATGTGYLKLTSQTVGETSQVAMAGGTHGGLAATIKMGLANGGREFTGDVENRPNGVAKMVPPTSGVDGVRGAAADLEGSESGKTGMYALLDADLFNILSIPETYDMEDLPAGSVIRAGVALCEARRALYIVDAPRSKNYSDIGGWANGVTLSRNAAVYFPAVRIADPLDNSRLRSVAPSGTVAGVYARTDSSRGIWKAPAGTDATMNGVVELTRKFTDLENGNLNRLGVNVLRSFPSYGRVVWGARTMKGGDAQADEYKYVPVRRLALFIEESLYRGTQWVVFEPNDEPLWSQIRLNIGAFMHNLFRQGAFQGASPRDAYLVKCDRETTTQNDIDQGIVNILVGFAPLKPAEFVVIRIQQMAGQVEA